MSFHPQTLIPPGEVNSKVASILNSLRLSVLIHATEDADRILAASGAYLKISSEEFRSEELIGHFKNPVARLSYQASDEEADRIARHIATALTEEDYQTLRKSVENDPEQKAIHFRINRDALISGKVRLNSTDPFKIEFRPRRYSVDTRLVETLECIRSAIP
jgi:RNA binding exosome subunit